AAMRDAKDDAAVSGMQDAVVEAVEGPVRLASSINEGINKLAPEYSLTGQMTGWAAEAQSWTADQIAELKAGRPENVIAAGVYDEQKLGATVAMSMAPVGPLRLTRPSAVAEGAANAARGTQAGAKAFHHTVEGAVESISRTGLRPGSYATPTSGLSPLQAHIELALNPAGGARN